MVKAKVKADRAAARSANAGAQASSAPSRAHTPTTAPATPAEEDTSNPSIAVGTAPEPTPEIVDLPIAPVKEVAVDRAELLRSKSQVVNYFIRLIVPILVDVYAATVSIPVRIKSLTALLKAICFLDSEQLKRTLKVRSIFVYEYTWLICPDPFSLFPLRVSRVLSSHPMITPT